MGFGQILAGVVAWPVLVFFGWFGVCLLLTFGVGFVTYDGYDTTLATFLIGEGGKMKMAVFGWMDDSFFDITIIIIIINIVCLTWWF